MKLRVDRLGVKVEEFYVYVEINLELILEVILSM